MVEGRLRKCCKLEVVITVVRSKHQSQTLVTAITKEAKSYCGNHLSQSCLFPVQKKELKRSRNYLLKMRIE